MVELLRPPRGGFLRPFGCAWFIREFLPVNGPIRIPYKFTRMRYPSFTRYFSHLKRLGYVKETGRKEPSLIQESYPLALPRCYYRLTESGRKATISELSDSYHEFLPLSGEKRSPKRKRGVIYSPECGKSAGIVAEK